MKERHKNEYLTSFIWKKKIKALEPAEGFFYGGLTKLCFLTTPLMLGFKPPFSSPLQFGPKEWLSQTHCGMEGGLPQPRKLLIRNTKGQGRQGAGLTARGAALTRKRGGADAGWELEGPDPGSEGQSPVDKGLVLPGLRPTARE